MAESFPEIKEYKTKDGDTFQSVNVGGGYIAPRNAAGRQPNFVGSLTINKIPLQIAAWWKSNDGGNERSFLSLAVSFKQKKGSQLEFEVLPPEILKELNLPDDFNEKVREMAS